MIKLRKDGQIGKGKAVRASHTLTAESCADKTAIAARFKQARELLKLERPEFAHKLGSSVSAIGDYERGRSAPGTEVLAALARLGVNTHWLLTNDGPPLLEGAAARAHAGMIPRATGESTKGQGNYEDALRRYREMQAAYDAACEELGYRPPFNVGEALKVAMLNGLQGKELLPILEALKYASEKGGVK